MRYFDTHCHLDFEVYDLTLQSLLAECRSVGVDRFLIPSTRVSSIPRLISIQRQSKGVYIALGIHPFFIDESSLRDMGKLEEYLIESLTDPSLVAVGEIGLDRSCNVDFILQQEVFEAQLRLASKFGFPVILHNRKSDQQIIEALDRCSIVGGVIHGFSGSYETAKLFIDRNFKIGLGGVITWENARKVRRMVERLPLESIVLETDAPDMSPRWLKGNANSPVELPRIAEFLSDLKQVDQGVLSEQVYNNSCELFLKNRLT